MVKRVLAVAAAIGAGLAVSRLRRRRPNDGASAVPRVTRVARNAELARLGTNVGATVAANKARRVFASAERKEQLDRELELKTSAQVAESLGHMKGALMKIGQMASYLDEGLPEHLRTALAQLQADAPPMSPELAAHVIEEELGAAPDKVFAEWDPIPMAAASIGQVHRAITKDEVAVAVKVQYPGVEKAILADLDNTDLMFQAMGLMFPGLDPAPLVSEIRDRLVEELDYQREADNQQIFVDYYEGHPFIHVPSVVRPLSAKRVLTTELAEGARFDEIDAWCQDEKNLAAEAIFRFVFRSLYRLHVFNGDPHPGNYLFRPGGQVTFLDFGLVKHFNPPEVETFESMIRTMVLSPDPEGFRQILEGVGLLHRGAPVTTEQLIDYMAHFYDFVQTDEVRTLTPEYASATLRKMFDTKNPVNKHVTVPASFVIIQRINLGLYAILARLNATANWRKIAEELWPTVSGPPSTELGQKEASWITSRTSPR
jgi:predicted unusual protein kinase regulating ubiquinone biosynthesis (AarF/ABC1/UbiB family)